MEAHFYSVAEILEYLKQSEKLFPGGCYSHSFREEGFCSFSWKEAITLLESGWPEGSQDIDLRVNAITQHTQETKWEYQHEVQGEFLDIGHYLSGQPDCFMTTAPIESITEEVSIVVNADKSGAISENTIRNWGAALTALIDQLQRNYFVNLTFVLAAQINKQYSIIYYHMDTKSSYSRDLVAFITANSAFLRRIGFAINEIMLKQPNLGGYGHPLNVPVTEGTLYFPCMVLGADGRPFATIESATQEVQRLITETEQRQETHKEADHADMS